MLIVAVNGWCKYRTCRFFSLTFLYILKHLFKKHVIIFYTKKKLKGRRAF